jgi:dUTPase
MANQKVKIKLLDSKAKIPVRAHDTDSGYDLEFIGFEKIEGDVIFFKTGITLQPPKGHYFEVVPRSSISKLPLAMANSVGVIDEAYRGEILVPVRILHKDQGEPRVNLNPSGIVSIFGIRPQTMEALASLILKNKPVLFQAILRKRLDCDFVLEEDLDSTDRQDGGFGSTDK